MSKVTDVANQIEQSIFDKIYFDHGPLSDETASQLSIIVVDVLISNTKKAKKINKLNRVREYFEHKLSEFK
jgi:hypothetical protein